MKNKDRPDEIGASSVSSCSVNIYAGLLVICELF